MRQARMCRCSARGRTPQQQLLLLLLLPLLMLKHFLVLPVLLIVPFHLPWLWL
jgi:hypothetical protein